MKKTISVFFAVIFILASLALPASAESAEEVNYANTSVVFHSDVAGLIADNYEQLADISASNLEFRELDGKVRVSIYNCVGTPNYCDLRPGRTNEIDYEFVAADGYVLPKDFDLEDLGFVCDKGCKVYYCHYIDHLPEHVPQIPLLYVHTEVRVDGNIFQRIIGKLVDIYIEIRAWSLY